MPWQTVSKLPWAHIYLHGNVVFNLLHKRWLEFVTVSSLALTRLMLNTIAHVLLNVTNKTNCDISHTDVYKPQDNNRGKK